MVAVQNNVNTKYAFHESKMSNESIDEKSDNQSYDLSKIKSPVDTEGVIDLDSSACYDRSILHPERREELLERMLNSMSNVAGLEKIRQYDENLGKEIYAFSMYDGKVHVSGNEGFEHKAHTYEKLINASLNKSWNCLFKGAFVNETKLLDTVDGILKYYMDVDHDYKKNHKKDSITNHVGEAFQKWCKDYRQKEFHLDRRI